MVRDGLTHAPGSKTLLALWKELGGGPLPTPVEKPAPPAEAQQESPEPPADPQPAAGQ